jgi:hypothetical protein
MTNDDPKLTAYALNELDEADRAEVEAYLAENPAERQFVEETRRTVALLTGGLHVMNVPALTTLQRETISAAASTPALAQARRSYEPNRYSARRVWMKWTLATAACVAVTGLSIFSYRQTPIRRQVVFNSQTTSGSRLTVVMTKKDSPDGPSAKRADDPLSLSTKWREPVIQDDAKQPLLSSVGGPRWTELAILSAQNTGLTLSPVAASDPRMNNNRGNLEAALFDHLYVLSDCDVSLTAGEDRETPFEEFSLGYSVKAGFGNLSNPAGR